MSVWRSIARRFIRRVISSIPAIIGVVIVTFILMRVLPSDPAVFFTSSSVTAGQAEIDSMRKKMGLDQPLPLQLGMYLRDVARGDLGNSLTTNQPVVKDLLRRLPASLELTFVALVLALATSIPLGVLSALRSGSLIDHAVRFLCTIGVCMPTFVSGLMLVYVFYYLLGIAPDPTGRIDIFVASPPDITGFLLIDLALIGDWAGWRSALDNIILPACTMALFVLAPLTRMTRASMLGVLGSEFVRTAKSVGLHSWRIVVVYALRNALLPVLTMAGVVFSTMLGANVLVEKVFSWPGVASYALDALMASDYAPVQGFVLLMAFIFVLVNLTVDVLYGMADPRVSIE
ncbi:ABC transporter permease [Bradyrhizobium mercantei]|uniref:ABC transporter permease n=1 Tax=Bradyrhizobium mercantei TaxID=1904807 RepID=UPI0009765C5F|nr:ABC transporter permease [Bradyrhizobium mercantei]